MRVDEFDFDLPEDLIALRPVRPRRASRLLVAGPSAMTDSTVEALPDFLRPGDLLVINDTRVIPARLFGERTRETADGPGVAKIEATLLAREDPATWSALAKPGKRLRPGDVIQFAHDLTAEVAEKGEGGGVRLTFNRSGPDLDAAIAAAGVMPLPPYIAAKRAADDRDRQDYQTVFATRPGAVAAPTASLHFDDTLLAALAEKGIETAHLTLHVGAGTFLPVKSETVEGHRMHAEWGEIGEATAAAVNRTKAEGGRVIPVGTTALRLLESAAVAPGRLAPWRGETDIFITPGFRFQIADGLMTNFHLPRSTLLMLVAALMGQARMREIYAHAIANRYRFYSYGDSSLLLPQG